MPRFLSRNCEALFLDSAIGKGTIRHPVDILVKGHSHRYRMLELSNRLLVQLPAFKAFFPYKNSQYYPLHLPDLGGVKFTISKNEIRMEKKLYDTIPILDALEQG